MLETKYKKLFLICKLTYWIMFLFFILCQNTFLEKFQFHFNHDNYFIYPFFLFGIIYTIIVFYLLYEMILFKTENEKFKKDIWLLSWYLLPSICFLFLSIYLFLS